MATEWQTEKKGSKGKKYVYFILCKYKRYLIREKYVQGSNPHNERKKLLREMLSSIKFISFCIVYLSVFFFFFFHRSVHFEC